MKRLIWKEWREKRIWTLAFFVFAAGPVLLLRDALSFGGKITETSPFVFLLLIPALLLGLNTFSKETGYECQDFLFSRAIGWKSVLWAKILVDWLVMLVGITGAAIIYRLFLPSDYTPFVSIMGLAVGILLAFVVAVIGYMPGFGASAVLPGVFGGGLVLGLIILAAATEYTVFYVTEMSWIPLLVSWLVAIVLSSVLMAKRGIGLSTKERALKYLTYTAITSTAMLVLTIPTFYWLSNTGHLNTARFQQNTVITGTDVSPDGRFLLEEKRTPSAQKQPDFLVRRSDGLTKKLDVTDLQPPNAWWRYGWYPPDTLVVSPWSNGAALTTLRINETGQIIQRKTPLPWPGRGELTLSPNGRYAAVLYNIRIPGSTDKQKPTAFEGMTLPKGSWLTIVDLQTMKRIFTRSFPNENGRQKRWESDTRLIFVGDTSDEKYNTYTERIIELKPDGKVTVAAGRTVASKKR